MRFYVNIFFLLAFFCLLPFFAFILEGQTVYVPLNHQVYDFLDRMEIKHVLPVVHNNTKPMTRREIGEQLGRILASSRKSLSRTDQDLLHYFVFLFAEEINADPDTNRHTSRWTTLRRHACIDPWAPDFLYENSRDLVHFSDGPLDLFINPVFLRRYRFAASDSAEFTGEATNGLSIWGTLGDVLGFFSDVRDTKEWGDGDYPGEINVTRPGLGFVRGGGDHLYHDETVASVVFSHKVLTLQLGKDENRWGPGYRGQLTLSDAATSYDQIKLQIRTSRLKFTSLLAWMKHYTPDFFYGNHQEKSFAAHRLEVSPWTWLDLGLSETVVFSGRRWEISYITPVMFFRSAEHYHGDRDNATISVDWVVKAVSHLAFYGEWFIDDLKTSRLGSDFYGNKHAWLFGVRWADPLGLDDVDFVAEYARIRPYTYSHKFQSTNYTHYNTLLGHWSGPNSDDFFTGVNYRYSRRLSLSFFYEKRRHGQNSSSHNAGGDVALPPAGPADAPFLGGRLQRENRMGGTLEYRALPVGYIGMQYMRDWNNGAAGEAGSCLQLSFSLNY